MADIILPLTIRNTETGYIADSKNIKGGYVSAATIADRDAIPAATLEAGSLCYVVAEEKFYQYDGSAWFEKQFSGEEYTAGDGISIANHVITNTDHALVPAQASAENQLADKDFVNKTVQTATANFRGNWATWASVPTDASLYPADYTGSHTPTKNDYLVLQDASGYPVSGEPTSSFTVETTSSGGSDASIRLNIAGSTYNVDYGSVSGHYVLYGDLVYVGYAVGEVAGWSIKCVYPTKFNGQSYAANTVITSWLYSATVNYTIGVLEPLRGTWFFKYTGVWDTVGKAGWLPEYQVSREPLSPAQIAALNSGITASKVAEIDTKLTDVKIDNTSVVTGTVANIPVATNTSLGVVIGTNNGSLGVGVGSNGTLYAQQASSVDVTQKTNQYKPITPYLIDSAVREGLGNNSLSWTNQYKENARTTIEAQQQVEFVILGDGE